jgi:hypothetical protein
MRQVLLVLALLFGAVRAEAEEPHGCDKFAWDVSAAQALLADAVQPAEAGPLDRDSGTAFALALLPLADAKLELPPERTPKDPASFAGLVHFAPAGEAGTYAVTLAAGAWIDVVQDGAYLKPLAFTGALDCPHVRKSVRFRIAPGPFTLQVSGAAEPTIDLVVGPVR